MHLMSFSPLSKNLYKNTTPWPSTFMATLFRTASRVCFRSRVLCALRCRAANRDAPRENKGGNRSRSMSSRGGRGGGRGRGWYYKEKYGGGGRGRGRGGGGGTKRKSLYEDGQNDGGVLAGDDQYGAQGDTQVVGSGQDFSSLLQRIDGAGYGAYKDTRGGWKFPHYTLFVDHVQGDSYAPPSRFRVQVPQAEAKFPPELYATKIRNIALCDYLTRCFGYIVKSAGADVRANSGGWGGQKGGDMGVDRPGQHVMERSSVNVTNEYVEVRFTVALPAKGRTILGQWAHQMLVQNLPRYIQKGLLYSSQDVSALQKHILCAEDSEALRSQLREKGLVSFIGNGAILPRKSGASDEPMASTEAVPFQSPPSLEIELQTPNSGPVKGMGIKKGVTLIVGGGFHGKTTVLKAIEVGIYNKIPGDGRERVVTDNDAVKIRAEDGRQVAGVNISPFLNNLPYGKDTTNFCSPDASGSTSQAANIQEALELRATALLVDEDTCATNFMIRDKRMQALVSKEKEPITPFIARIRALTDEIGVSTVLVIGGSGDYFDVADTVVCMDSFKPHDVTDEARKIASQIGESGAQAFLGQPYGVVTKRTPVSVYGQRGAFKMGVRDLDTISFGDESVDLSSVEQIVEISQTRAICDALRYLNAKAIAGQLRGMSLEQIASHVDREVDEKGLDVLSGWVRPGNLARPRRFEILSALNRLRSVQIQQISS